MNNLKIKICGIKTVDVALACLDVGVNYLGFNFAPSSRRFIELDHANKIISKIENFKDIHSIKYVALVFKTPMQDLIDIIKTGMYDYIQYVVHDETFSRINKENLKYIPQIGIREKTEEQILPYSDELIILDSYQEKSGGGSGKVFQWDYISEIKRNFLLAGGLNPENVSEAVSVLKPFGVDVASGVEGNDGEKDILKIMRFVKNARG